MRFSPKMVTKELITRLMRDFTRDFSRLGQASFFFIIIKLVLITLISSHMCLMLFIWYLKRLMNRYQMIIPKP